MNKADEVLTRGVSQILPTKKGLADLMVKQKITIYQGIDPSMPSLHLGNLVGLMKLRQFQRLGHKIIFLVGDFTGMIGDPTDKLATRKKLSREEVLQNSKAWKKQIENILDFNGDNPVEVRFNSEWLDRITFKDLIEITSNLTVQQMIERDMFQKRLSENKPIYLHEFLYPVAQGYDSVAMDVDLEIGGNDQLFNMLTGRTLLGAMKNKEKYILSTKLLVDKDGRKVGKTTGNALFLDSTPEDLYSGIMSFPDETITLAFELLTEVDIDGIAERVNKDPLAEKKKLALEITSLLWGKNKANIAQENFEKTFQKHIAPSNMVEVKLTEESLPLLDLVFASKSVSSRSEAKRLINQKAIEVDGKVMTDPNENIEIPKSGLVIKIGKARFVRFRLK